MEWKLNMLNISGNPSPRLQGHISAVAIMLTGMLISKKPARHQSPPVCLHSTLDAIHAKCVAGSGGCYHE